MSGGAGPTGTITFKLYGPNDEQCTQAAVFSSASTATGAGYYGSESFTPQSAGTYRWVDAYSGDSNNHAAGPTACGADSETVTVSRAITALSTRVPDAIDPAGSEIYDTANLTDGVSPAGTLSFKLYGPNDTRRPDAVRRFARDGHAGQSASRDLNRSLSRNGGWRPGERYGDAQQRVSSRRHGHVLALSPRRRPLQWTTCPHFDRRRVRRQ